MKAIIIILISIFLNAGCKSVIENIGKKQPDPPPQIIGVKGIEDGLEYKENITNPDKILTFDRVEQEYEINKGEDVLLKLDYNIYQDDDLFIMSSYNKDSNKIKIGLYDHFREEIVVLQKKCDVIEIRGLYEIPKINLDPSLDLKQEQIIITPMFDEECRHVGFQIRYGSSVRDCKDVAKIVLDRYKECADKNIKGPKKGKKVTCWSDIWFGVKCK